MKQALKVVLVCVVGVMGISSLVRAENSDWSAGPGGMGDKTPPVRKDGEFPPAKKGGRGAGGRGPRSLAGPEAMKSCFTAAGVTVTKGERPELSEAQRTQIDSCVKSIDDQMKTCLTSAGISLPDPSTGEKPAAMDDATKSAIDTCRAQVASGSVDSSTEESADTSTDTSESTSTFSSAAAL